VLVAERHGGRAGGCAAQRSQIGMGGFDQSLRKAVLEGGVDGPAVSNDAAGQFNEHRDAAAPGPADPPVQGLLALFSLD